MDLVADLVTAPFTDIVEKATVALGNADDNTEMKTECQKLIKGAERILKTVKPLCTRLWSEYERNFVDELQRHDEIAKYRLELNDLLWDFEDFTEADTFDKEAYGNLQRLCKTAGLAISEILKRMQLEPIARSPGIADASPTFATTASVPALSPSESPVVGGGLNISNQSEPKIPTTLESLPETESGNERDGNEGKEQYEEPLADPPPPPSTDPWDIKTARDIDSTPVDNGGPDHIRRQPVSSGDSDIGSPTNPNVMQADLRSHRRLDEGVTIMEAEAEAERRMANADPSSSEVARPPPPETTDRNLSLTSEDSLAPSPMIPNRDVPDLSATIFSSGEYRVSYGGSSRSRDSMQEAFSPAESEHRGSVQSMPENPDAITGGFHDQLCRRPIIPPNFPPGVDDGLEAVVREQPAEEGLIPAETETFGQHATSNGQASPRPQRDCTLGLDSSFFLYKGFCEGAKEMTRGGNGMKKVKKPGFQGSHTVARCTGCDFESDSHHLELDQKQSEAENFVCSGVGYRVRFLQKSHLATTRSDEQLFGCIFCAHSQRTLEECDATVFFTPRKLFEHLGRHPRPLPRVPGFTVIEEAEVPFNLRNNYDLHFKKPPVASPLDAVRESLASLPMATAVKPVRRMYGMRMLHDQTPAFELADGARITGIEFPAKYQGEWALGWHDAAKKSVPFDVIRLVPPPRSEMRMGGTSTITAVARWKFAPKAKDWLKFDKGEVISNISHAYPGHWCWSGTNAKGKWGIFPQTFIDTNTVREFAADRASIISNESKRSRFGILRKGARIRPPSFSGPSGGSTGRVF